MGRWEPDAGARLQQAAFALFLERGYGEVTIAEIADRAGLTKRTFFNHFTDKREVLFAGATAFQASIVSHLVAADADLDPIDAAVLALAVSGRELGQWSEFARARREMIASAPELQERDLNKRTSLASAIAEALLQRGVAARAASLTAQVAVVVFTAAYDDWVDDSSADFHELMQRSLADVRRAACPTVHG